MLLLGGRDCPINSNKHTLQIFKTKNNRYGGAALSPKASHAYKFQCCVCFVLSTRDSLLFNTTENSPAQDKESLSDFGSESDCMYISQTRTPEARRREEQTHTRAFAANLAQRGIFHKTKAHKLRRTAAVADKKRRPDKKEGERASSLHYIHIFAKTESSSRGVRVLAAGVSPSV